MANLFAASGKNILFLQNFRRLSSFNNNRTKFGIVSILKNEELNNIWSDSHWSELGKQFNKSAEFPLPGQTGIQQQHLKRSPLSSFMPGGANLKEATAANKTSEQVSENLEYLMLKPLPQESQALKLKEAAGGLFYKGKMDNCLFNSVGVTFDLSVHQCPVSLAKDFQTYFKSNLLNESSVNVLTISFKTENDMAMWSADVDNEREVLMKKFVDTAQEICSLLERAGYWADYIDPSNGKPYKSAYTHATFYETDERYRQLGFEINDYGCCKVISHHLWGTKTYVGSLLTNAPQNSEFLIRLLKKFNE